MSFDLSELSMEKALSMAIRAEKDAADIYRRLNDKIQNFVLKEKIYFLIGEEEKHQRLLEALFEKMFPEQTPDDVKETLVPNMNVAVGGGDSVPDLLKQAMDAELIFESFYQQLSDKVEDSGMKKILHQLSKMEHGHFDLLNKEYENCLKDEEYYTRGDFEYDMVHIGP